MLLDMLRQAVKMVLCASYLAALLFITCSDMVSMAHIFKEAFIIKHEKHRKWGAKFSLENFSSLASLHFLMASPFNPSQNNNLSHIFDLNEL